MIGIGIGIVFGGKPGVSVPGIRLTADTIAEDAAGDTEIGTASVANAPDGVTYTWAITADPDSKFSIVEATGVLSLATLATLNFENATSHQVTIEATPSAGDPVSREFTITVGNVIEAPVNLVAPAVAGVAQVGEVIQCSNGTWTDMGSGSSGVFTYQWKDAADDSDIVGQIAATFAVTGEWVGDSVYCTVTATNSADSAAEDSDVAGPFDPAPGAGAEDSFLRFDQGGITGLHLGMI